MTLKSKAASGVFWNISANGFNQIVNLFVYLLLARLLEVEDFGLVAFAFLIIEFGTIFINIGINQNLIKREEWCDSFASSAFWFTNSLSLILALILVLVVAPIAYYQYSEASSEIIMSLAILPVITGLRLTHLAKLQREFENRKIAGIESIAIVIGSAVSVGLALKGFNAWSIVFGRIVQAIVDVILVWFVSDFFPKFKIDSEHMKEIIRFGLPLFYSSLVTFFSGKSMNIAVGFFLGPTAFAFLSLARRPFMALLSLSMQQLNKITFAAISRVSEDMLPSIYYRVISITAFFVIPVYLGFGAISKPFVEIFLSDKWIECIDLMYIFCLQAPAFIVSWYLPSLLISRGETKIALKLNILVCISNIIFSLIGVCFGAVGAVAGVIISAYVTLPLRYKVVSRYIDISFMKSLKCVTPFVFSGLTMYLSVAYISINNLMPWDNPIVNFLGVLFLGSFIYVGLMLTVFHKSFKLVLMEIKNIKN